MVFITQPSFDFSRRVAGQLPANTGLPNPFLPSQPRTQQPMRPVPLYPPAPGAGRQWQGMDADMGYRPNPFHPSGPQNFLQNISPLLIGYGAALTTGSPEFGHRLMNRSFEQLRDRRESMASRDALSNYLVQAERPRLAELARTNPEMAVQLYRGEATGTDSGMAPVHGVDAEGNPVLMQPTRAGEVRQLKMPEGVTLAPGFERVDAGTHWLLVDKKTGRVVDTIPKNLYEKGFETKSGEAAGTAAGQAQAALPAKIEGLNESIRLIDAILADPALDQAVGPIQGQLPSIRADSRRFDERVEQLKGKAFLQARAELKGGGSITDYEGQRAEAALLRASQAKSEEDFRAAMMEFRAALQRGFDILRQQSGTDIPPAPAASQPGTIQPGEVRETEVDGMRGKVRRVR